ncbi:CPBP family intramembrane glutamic endopeptidase [Lewinella sp. 4G2]|uniref:CPBP family intramembrane glutamic endopeptidase n=1 Tax=Lewinella sp. 4G2 TaxID=1803372 RepID=UPI0007B4BBE7|nr:CPBP family intramembrane glutamic endopeptidase [Lewinella sp. 4G2]OAV45632.1 hypothetical protein A3850_014520 [Lewinella sp. 4G2]
MTNVKPRSKTATRLLVATLISLVILFIAGQVIFTGILLASGFEIQSLLTGEFDLDAGQRQALRLGLFLNNLLLFAGAAIAGLWYVYRQNWQRSVYLDRGPVKGSLGPAILLFVVSLPVVAYSAYVNLQVPLPEWASQSEAATDQLLVQMLTMESIPELLLAVLTIGVVAGLGEELLLRGTFQKRILGGYLRSHHATIWLAAAIFSAMHIEFAGFLPRMILGASLGYAYHWTRSLWVPIILHTVFNGIQVIVAYVTGEFDPNAITEDVPEWWMGLIGLVLSIYVAYRAEQRFGEEYDVEEVAATDRPEPLE